MSSTADFDFHIPTALEGANGSQPEGRPAEFEACLPLLESVVSDIKACL